MGTLSSSGSANVIFGTKVNPQFIIDPGGGKPGGGCSTAKGICNMHGSIADGAVDVEFTMNSSLPLIMRMVILDKNEFFRKQPTQKPFFNKTSGLYTFDNTYPLTDSLFQEFNLPPNSSITKTDMTHYHINGNIITITTTITHPPVTPAPAPVFFGTAADGTGIGIFGDVPSDTQGAVPVTFTFTGSNMLTLSFSFSALNANQQANFPGTSGSYQFAQAYQIGGQSFFQGMGIPPDTTITTFDTPTYTIDGDTVTLTIPVNTLVGNLVFGAKSGDQCDNSMPGIFSVATAANSAPTTTQGQDAISVPVVFVATPTGSPLPNPALFLQLGFSMNALLTNQPQQAALFSQNNNNSGAYPFNTNFTLPAYIVDALSLPQGVAILNTDPSTYDVNPNVDLATVTVTLCTATGGFILLGDNSGGSCSQDDFGICQVTTDSTPIDGATPVAAVYTLLSSEWLGVSFQLSDLPANQQAWFPGTGGDLLMPSNAVLPDSISTLLGFASGVVVTIVGGNTTNVNYVSNLNNGMVTIPCQISQS